MVVPVETTRTVDCIAKTKNHDVLTITIASEILRTVPVDGVVKQPEK